MNPKTFQGMSAKFHYPITNGIFQAWDVALFDFYVIALDLNPVGAPFLALIC